MIWFTWGKNSFQTKTGSIIAGAEKNAFGFWHLLHMGNSHRIRIFDKFYSFIPLDTKKIFGDLQSQMVALLSVESATLFGHIRIDSHWTKRNAPFLCRFNFNFQVCESHLRFTSFFLITCWGIFNFLYRGPVIHAVGILHSVPRKTKPTFIWSGNWMPCVCLFVLHCVDATFHAFFFAA